MTDGQTNDGSADAGASATDGDSAREAAGAPPQPWWAAPVEPATQSRPHPELQPQPEMPQSEMPQPEFQPQPETLQYDTLQHQTPQHEVPGYGTTHSSASAFAPPATPAPPQHSQPQYSQAPSWPPPSWQSPYAAPTVASPYGERTGDIVHRKDKNGTRLPSLLLVAVVAALIGAAVGAGFVAANKKTPGVATTTPPAGNAAPTVIASLPAGSVASVAQTLLPSVVSITVTGVEQQDEGTGIILSPDGQILTNNHVVEGAASSGVIAVTFSDGRTVTASIVGRDPTSDLAVVKAQGVSGLHPATMGKDSSLIVGEQVVAVGSPLGLSNSVTSGIVSSLNRPVCTQNCGGSSNGATPTVLDAIQTDAAINPGNSGGPLVDMAGRVIGINSAIATLDQQPTSGQSGNIGVGFAIPIDEANRVIAELQKTGHASHAVIGIGVDDSVDATLHTPNGAKIVSVTAGGPAANAGLRVGDILVKFGDRTVVDADSLIAATHAATPNSAVTVGYLRGGRQLTAQVTLSSATSG